MKIALEGPSFAGKTTLCERAALERRGMIAVVKEFVAYAGGAENFPQFPPTTREAALHASRFFFLIEERRQREASRISEPMKLFDRSTITIAAFEYAAMPFTGIDVLREVEAMVMERREWLPDLVVVLRVSGETIVRRAQICAEVRGQLFVDEEFNRRFSQYLMDAPRRFGVRTEDVDAEADADHVAGALYRILGV